MDAIRYYTGVGARDISEDVAKFMGKIAVALESMGFVLRTGNAQGSDLAFRSAVKDDKHKVVYTPDDATDKSIAMAQSLHPAWNRCNNYVRRLLGRNPLQVLGDNLDSPSEFMVCWTPDGCADHDSRRIGTGGTGTAISVADKAGIKIFNLRQSAHRKWWAEWLEDPKPLQFSTSKVEQSNSPKNVIVKQVDPLPLNRYTVKVKKQGYVKLEERSACSNDQCDKQIQVYAKIVSIPEIGMRQQVIEACACGYRRAFQRKLLVEAPTITTA